MRTSTQNAVQEGTQALARKVMVALLTLGIVGVIGIVLVALIWNMIFVYVKPGYMGVVNCKMGKALEPGQILARPGQKGVQEAVLGEGRHFINPLIYSVEIRPCVMIPAGKIGVVTSKVGTNRLDNVVVVEEGEKGTWRRVLTPGMHRLNPYGYDVKVADAAVITPGYVGFLTRLQGRETTNAFAGPGEKGMVRKILQPGIYYINPVEYRVAAVEIGINQVTFAPPERERYAHSTVSAAPQAAAPSAMAGRGRAMAETAPYQDLAQAEQVAWQERAYQARTSQMADWLTSSYSAKQKAETERIIRDNVANQIAQQGVEVRGAERKDEAGKRGTPAAITFPSSDGFMIS